MKLINFIIFLAIAFSLYSCQSLETPTGFIAIKDSSPPILTLLSTSSNIPVKDSLIIQFKASDFSGIQGVEIKINGHNQYVRSEPDKDIYTYKMDISFLEDTCNVAVTAYDHSGNYTTKNLLYIVKPIIKHITFPGISNNDLTIYKGISDKNGVIWFMCEIGLIKLIDKTYLLNPPGFSLSRKYFNSLAVDGSGKIWFDHKEIWTGDHQTLGTYNGVLTPSVFDFPNSTDIVTYAFDAYDTLWGCWPNGWFSYKDGNLNLQYRSGIFMDVAVDQQNNKWFATSEGVKKFDGLNWITFNSSNSVLPGNHVSRIKVDKKNRVWVLVDGELLKYEGGQWKGYWNFAEGEIKSFCIDGDDNFWIGINGYVVKFDGQKTLRKFSTGTPTDLFADSHDNIWIGTDYGIYKINLNGF